MTESERKEKEAVANRGSFWVKRVFRKLNLLRIKEKERGKQFLTGRGKKAAGTRGVVGRGPGFVKFGGRRLRDGE